MELWHTFLAQLGVVQNAWMPFGIAVAIVALAIWKIAGWHSAATIETLQHRLQLRDDQIAQAQRHSPGGSVTYGAPGHHHSTELREAAPPNADPIERAFVGKSVTPYLLIQMCQNKTLVQAEGAVGIYLGKWMQVSGPVVEVARAGLCMEVTLEIPLNPETVQHLEKVPRMGLLFETNTAHVEALHRGDILRAVGKIERIRTYFLALHECEFVSSE